MPASSRPFPLPGRIVMIAAMAFVLTGCGIKSGLEKPQPARLAEPAGAISAAADRAPQETSRVEAQRGFHLLPPETPPEWEKDKPKKNRTSTTKAGSKSTAPDKPFILDSLL